MYDEYTLNTPFSPQFGIKSFEAHSPHLGASFLLCVFDVRAEQVTYYMETIVPYWSCTVMVIEKRSSYDGIAWRRRRGFRYEEFRFVSLRAARLHSLCFWSPEIKMEGGHAKLRTGRQT